MIKEKKVNVKIGLRNISHYRDMGYDVSVINNENKTLPVSVYDIPRKSKIRITAICEVCGSENSIQIVKYWTNHGRHGFYSCFKCKNVKKEKTNLIKYGEKSYSKTEEFKEKFKSTCLDRYGVDNPNKLKSVRKKIEATCESKYGVSSPLLKESVIENNKKWMSSQEFKDKSKKTLIEKYGVDSFSKTDEFKKMIQVKKEEIVDKIKKTFNDKYGFDHYSQTDQFKEDYLSKIDEIGEKRIETCLSRYGVDNVAKVNEFMKKTIATKIERGLISDGDDEWIKYKKKVRRITNRFKKELFNRWEGYDYYDDEYIKDNFRFSHTHRFYPTIDHKISVFYGYQNNIDASIVGHIDNLCITKRYINSIKRTTIDSEFISSHRISL